MAKTANASASSVSSAEVVSTEAAASGAKKMHASFADLQGAAAAAGAAKAVEDFDAQKAFEGAYKGTTKKLSRAAMAHGMKTLIDGAALPNDILVILMAEK